MKRYALILLLVAACSTTAWGYQVGTCYASPHVTMVHSVGWNSAALWWSQPAYCGIRLHGWHPGHKWAPTPKPCPIPIPKPCPIPTPKPCPILTPKPCPIPDPCPAPSPKPCPPPSGKWPWCSPGQQVITVIGGGNSTSHSYSYSYSYSGQ